MDADCKRNYEFIENKITGANKGFPKAGLKFFDWTFVQGSRLVFPLNFYAKNPRLRKAPKRCMIYQH